MNRNKVILITGLPGTGKTTLGEKIAKHFRLPFFNKDGLKETLFDSLGWRDRAWSKKLSSASYELMYYFIKSLLAADQNFVVESNFTRKNQPALQALFAEYNVDCLQILCVTRGDVLFQRYTSRTRHPGHVDDSTVAEFESLLRQGRAESLELGGRLLEVDTTDFTRLVETAILQQIQEWIG